MYRNWYRNLHRSDFVSLAAAFAAPLWMGWAVPAHADNIRITGPVVHANLAIFFIHGTSAPGKVPLTLQEALAKGVVKVNETGDVNTLSIENLGDDEVFVQSGDLVKGGKQDRALTVSMLLPPKSGRIPIAAFCVEEGRWTARGGEDVRTFASSGAQLYSLAAKIAMKAPQPSPSSTASVGTPANDTGARQQEVWRSVRNSQNLLSKNVGQVVAAPQSATSLQLAYENEKLQTARTAYIKTLQPAGEKDGDIIGYVFAINGKINSADIYPSNGLFRKMWSKSIAANATEAIGEKSADAPTPPALAAVQAFLDAAEHGKASEKALPVNGRLETRVADQAFYFETRRPAGGWVHKNYLMK
jgi:hypothetical protein